MLLLYLPSAYQIWFDRRRSTLSQQTFPWKCCITTDDVFFSANCASFKRPDRCVGRTSSLRTTGGWQRSFVFLRGPLDCSYFQTESVGGELGCVKLEVTKKKQKQRLPHAQSTRWIWSVEAAAGSVLPLSTQWWWDRKTSAVLIILRGERFPTCMMMTFDCVQYVFDWLLRNNRSSFYW